MVTTSDWFAVPTALLAANTTLEVAATVGVPEISPLVAFTESPAGNPVAPKEVGRPLAVIWYVNAKPAVP
jgi:hypothetical protein